MLHHISTEDAATYSAVATTAPEPKPEPTCRWSFVASDGYWSTACSHAFCFSDDDPLMGGFCFCPFCGNRLLVDRSDPAPVDGPLLGR